MSAVTHTVSAHEVDALWPVIDRSGLWRDRAEFERLRAGGSWRVRLSDGGGLLVLDTWRERLGALAIKAAWHANEPLAELVADAMTVMREQGYAMLVSPLVEMSDAEAYLAAGMRERERLVIFQAHVDEVVSSVAPEGITIRPATGLDIEALCELDARCFPGLWRYGREELDKALLGERLVVAQDDGGRLLGYSETEMHRGSAVLGRLAVDESARRRGIATALVSDAADWSGSLGTTTLTLCTQADNQGSRALYAGCGFTIQPRERILFVGP